MSYQSVLALGGTLNDMGQPFVVSFWYIPGGTDYTNAEVRNGYFDEKQDAMDFVSANEEIPVMAFLMTREEYEKAKASAKRSAAISSMQEWAA